MAAAVLSEPSRPRFCEGRSLEGQGDGRLRENGGRVLSEPSRRRF